jgi:hypothetical protein
MGHKMQNSIFSEVLEVAGSIARNVGRPGIIAVAFLPVVVPTPAGALFPGQDKLDQCLGIGYVNELCPKIQQFGAAVALSEHPYRASFRTACTRQTGFSGNGDIVDMQARMTALMPRTKGCTAKIVDPDGPQ